MLTLLYINSSARKASSVSRALSSEFVQGWKRANPTGKVIERDLTATPLPHLDDAFVEASYTPAEARTPKQVKVLELSDQLIDELLAADIVVMASPMYNFSVSSVLKAWIDHVLRPGRTFSYDDSGAIGLVSDRRVIVFTARGGFFSQGEGKSLDFQETYLRGMFGFVGISQVEFMHTEGLSYNQDAAAKAIEATRASIPGLINFKYA
ncbi:MAG: FMN-dependent NADH-azoreductase [Georgfuchsia sp.]